MPEHSQPLPIDMLKDYSCLVYLSRSSCYWDFNYWSTNLSNLTAFVHRRILHVVTDTEQTKSDQICLRNISHFFSISRSAPSLITYIDFTMSLHALMMISRLTPSFALAHVRRATESQLKREREHSNIMLFFKLKWGFFWSYNQIECSNYFIVCHSSIQGKLTLVNKYLIREFLVSFLRFTINCIYIYIIIETKLR